MTKNDFGCVFGHEPTVGGRDARSCYLYVAERNNRNVPDLLMTKNDFGDVFGHERTVGGRDARSCYLYVAERNNRNVPDRS